MFARSHTPMRASAAVMLVLFLAAGPLYAWPFQTEEPVYIIGDWDGDGLHVANKDLHILGPLAPAGSPKPNALATDGSVVWSVRNTFQEMLVYDNTGAQVGWWEDIVLGVVQGMTYIPPDPNRDAPERGPLLAMVTDTEVRLHKDTGEFLRTIVPLVNDSYREGLAWDGQYLRAVGLTDIIAIDIGSTTVPGSIVAGMEIPSPAGPPGTALLEGMGMTANFPGQLTVVTSLGDWWVVHDDDGAVITSGNNGMEMYSLTAVVPSDATPEPLTAAILLAGMVPMVLVRRRRRLSR